MNKQDKKFDSESELEKILTKMNQDIADYLENISKNSKTFADVRKELHQLRFCYSKTPLEEAVVTQLLSMTLDKALHRSI